MSNADASHSLPEQGLLFNDTPDAADIEEAYREVLRDRQEAALSKSPSWPAVTHIVHMDNATVLIADSPAVRIRQTGCTHQHLIAGDLPKLSDAQADWADRQILSIAKETNKLLALKELSPQDRVLAVRYLAAVAICKREAYERAHRGERLTSAGWITTPVGRACGWLQWHRIDAGLIPMMPDLPGNAPKQQDLLDAADP